MILGVHILVGSETLQNGLVGHWKFDETNGTTAHDSSGNEYNAILYGTSNGSVSWVDGKVGGAIDLDGSNDYLAIETLKYNQAGQIPAVSISVWFKTSKSTEAYIVSYDRSENWRLSLGGLNDNKKLFFASSNNGGGTSDKYGATILNDNNWHHVVVTYDKVTSKKIFYLDGSVNATYTVHANRPLGKGVLTRYGTIGTTNEDDTFNHSSTTREDYFNGLLDDLRIYDRAISLSEAGILYSLGNRYGDPDGDGLYNFEEESLGTNPLLVDTDGDGLSDSVEVQKFTTFERVSRNGEFTFDEAVLHAESLGGHLATITNLDENNDVDEIATSNEWLGGTDKEVEGVWEWITGEAWLFEKWNDNEPNNSNNEDGLHIYSNGKWNDIPLSNNYAYILEKPDYTPISDPLNSDSDGDGFMDSLEIASGSNVNNDSSFPSDLPAFFGEATLWLDGTNVDLMQNTTITDGESISEWLDQSGNSHNLFVINSARSPVLNSASVNSKDVVSFTGDSLKTNEAIAVRSILAVHKTLNSHYLWDFRNDIPNSWIWHGGVGGYWTHHVKNGITLNNVSRANIMNNQLQVGYFAGNAMGSGSFYLHSRFSEAEMGSGDICELLVFDRLLTAQELDSGEAYLAKKWGLDSIVDSDSDGFNDSVEYDAGSNPESNGSIPDLGYGLVAWYPFDGNVSDMSGNGYDGGFADSANDPVVAPDRFDRPNRSFYFDGNDRLKLDHRALDGLSAFSISMWAKIETFEKMPLLLSGAKSHSLHNQCFFFYPSAAGYKIYFQENASNETLDLESSFGISTWRNLTLTRESGASSTKFYIDGSLEETFTFSSASASVDIAYGGLWLGADQDSVGGGWDSDQSLKGWLDEIRFYNRALNASEVNKIFEVTKLINSDATDVDDTAPEITLNGSANMIHEAGTLYVDANASWTDAVDGSGVLVSIGEVNASKLGTYTLSYSYTDAAGNVAQSVTRTVSVVDTTPPIITLNGDANITHEAGLFYVDANASWTDAVDGSGVLVSIGEVNASKPGTYTLSYSYTDSAGNVAQSVTRTVNVVDTTAPVITLNGDGNITFEAGSFYVDANASWTDAVDGSGPLVATGEVKSSVPGTYELAYNYTDEAGNEADAVIRQVHVINLAPHALDFFSDSNLSVYENEPGGTWIADFSGTDENPDSMLTYQLMGVMDTNLTLTEYANVMAESTDVVIEDIFDLDTNGSLITVRPLDYETDPIVFEIHVRVTDQHGAYFQKSFLVSVLNEVEDLDVDGVEDHYDLDDDGDGQTDELEIRLGLDPRDAFDHAYMGMVSTLDFDYLEDEQYRLRGKLLADGRASQIEYGFILTSTDRNSTMHKVTTDENGSSIGEEFTKIVGDLDRENSYFYQAYVINELGMGVGQMKWIRETKRVELPEILQGAEELEGGWYTSWMGVFWMGEERKWLYHVSLGWVFLSEDGQGGAWIWREPDGWLWTTNEVWPFLWSQQSTGWTYLIENLTPPRLYDYSTGVLR